MNISKQSMARIEDLKAMNEEARKIAIGVKIENPQIFKEFMESEEIQWDYAIAAGVLTREEVEYIKEEEESTEEPAEPAQGSE